MGLPAYCAINRAATATNVVVTPDEDALYPIANAHDGILANPFRSQATNDMLIEYQLGVSVNFCAILNHNFTGAQTVTLQYASGLYPASGTLLGTFPATTKDLLLTFDARTPAYLRITVNDSTHSGEFEIGELVIGHYLTLPAAERYGSTIGRRDEDTLLETQKGVRWVYKDFTRRYRKMKFRVPEPDLSAWDTLHTTTDGSRKAFLFIPDIDQHDVLYCRKDRDFLPVELDGPASVDGEDVPVYDVELELTEETRGKSILA